MVKKSEKLHTSRAKVQYVASQMVPGFVTAAEVTTAAQAGFINNAVNDLNPLTPGITPAVANQRYEQLKKLDDAIQETTRAQQTMDVAAPLLLPQLALLVSQKVALESSIAALTNAIHASFTEDYYTDRGYDLNAFFDQVSNLRSAADTTAEIHRQVALQVQAAAVAAPAAADDMDL